MAELRLVGVSEDGRHLVLADETGDQHLVAIDERMRAAVNGHLSRLGQLTMALEARISPREIQERVRSGESAEHVAATAGVPVERVLRFVGPVLREREHVAEQAQRARLAGVAGAAGPSSLLWDVVERAATRRGVDPEALSWDSARREDHSWLVTVSWPDGTVATWALDLLRHQAAPLDAVARKISGIAEEPPAPVVDGTDDEEPEHNVRRFVPRAVLDQPDLELDLTDDVPDETAASDDAEDHDTVVLHKDDSAGGDDAGRQQATDPEPAKAPSGRSRRARVPKWDDIMFGMKPKE